eukprot:7988651-Ditylum_brightwellii.AAC.1
MEDNNYVLVNTVAQNKNKYSPHDYSHAQNARQLQGILGNPSVKTLLDIVHCNLLPDCPITRDDVIAAEKIFGPDT